ncbi:uncharacterized protein LOC100908782 [Galendromus occidentalis]|uniref:Uncharacterized protein LOC100908782 n=1 Tax=Galendromus occidentalis TaxID=34638 RepID=A0AAJ7SFL6_9ACAR|nr:uncharacterized protein LOC100908782 [Galendromus occidentalis]
MKYFLDNAILLSCTLVAAVRAATLRIRPVALGQAALLNCSSEHFEEISRIRWYRDGEEFFRYDRRSREKLLFELPGLVVDVPNSHDGFLRLKRTEPRSEGVFSCELTDSKFNVERADANLQLYVLPRDEPYVRGVRAHYHPWERLNATCELTARPQPQLSWIVDGHLPPANSVVREHSEEHNGLVSVVSELQFNISSLSKDELKVECRAKILDAFDRRTQRISAISPGAAEEDSSANGEDDDPGPVIYGGRSHYHIGDILNSTCVYSGNKPALLRWFLNDVEVPSGQLVHYVEGGSEAKSALGIRFKVKPSHFVDGRLTIRCDANLESVFATHKAVRKTKLRKKPYKSAHKRPHL